MAELTKIWDAFANWLPNLLEAIIIFIIGWVVALIIKSIVTSVLKGLGLNRKAEESPTKSFIRRMTNDPSAAIGGFFYWLAMIIAITIVIGALKIPVLTHLVGRIYGYVPNILAAIVILLLSIGLSALVSSLIDRWAGDTPTGRITSTVIPVIILSIAGFAILEQLQLAPVIVTATYIAIIGAVSLGFALAFGLGGREVAGRMLGQAYEKGINQLGQVKRDAIHGKERVEDDIESVKRNR